MPQGWQAARVSLERTPSMKNMLIRLLINAAALWAAARWVDGIELTSDWVGILVVAFLFGLVNALIRPVVKFFAFPLILLTLGLATFVINGAMLWLTAQLTGTLSVRGLGAAVIGALVISIVSWLLSMLLPDGDDED